MKQNKLIQKLQNNPNDAKFDDLKKLLENAGYKMYNKGSSHFQFRKPGKDIITIPFARQIKPIYVKMTLKAIKDEIWQKI